MRRHALPVVLFAALTVVWTWPLVGHLRSAIPGEPGDNYSFLWNLWWLRHAWAAGVPYFHTDYLFHPFGTTIADHPHTALPALVAATVLRPADVITAQNLLLLACVFANLLSAYALVWSVTHHQRAAVVGGVIFGVSPYLAAHLLGHYDLMAAWLLPLFALAFRRALEGRTLRAAAAAGMVLAATAYTAYYYVVYLWFFAALYALAWTEWMHVNWRRRPPDALRRMRLLLLNLAAALGLVAVWIAGSGGQDLNIGSIRISAHAPQNVLTMMWICVVAYAFTIFRPEIRFTSDRPHVRHAFAVIGIVAVVFVAGSAPLLWQAASLMTRGEYVTPVYMWRTAPRGIDLLAPVLGPDAHPLVRPVMARVHAAAHIDRIEGVGWIGVVPALLIFHRPRDSWKPVIRPWIVVGAGFLIWALGPFLTVAGFDTGLRLPEILLRFVPLAANAHMPGRAMAGVFLALAVLIGVRLAGASGRLGTPAVQWLLVGLVVFEYLDAPVPLTMLDRPKVYQDLAALEPGAVCEAPFGIGDGLGPGAGSQDRRVLYYATVHEHPLAGGYIGRMPADARARYEQIPLTNALLRLSSTPALAPSASIPADAAPCRYLVVNKTTASAELSDFIRTLPVELISSGDNRELYRFKQR